MTSSHLPPAMGQDAEEGVKVRGAYPRVGGPSYRRELPGRVVMALGLFMSGCCVALIIVVQLGG